MTDIRYRASDQVTRELVDMRDGTHEPRVVAHPPSSLLTDGGNGPSARLRVDVAQTGFFAGREFRTFYEFNVAAGASVWIQVTAPLEFILFEQLLTVDSGGLRLRAYTAGTPSGTFSAPLPIIGKNRMLSRPQPYYVPQITMATGGTHTGGTLVETFRVVAGTATAQQRTVGGAQASERGLPAGSYYIQLENIGTGSATGVYSLFWEERP